MLLRNKMLQGRITFCDKTEIRLLCQICRALSTEPKAKALIACVGSVGSRTMSTGFSLLETCSEFLFGFCQFSVMD